MRREHFASEMNRLAGVFGAGPYAEARRNLIWNEVGSMGDAFFTRVVDRLIGESRYAPLLPEFREASAIERENQWRHEKKEHAKDAKDWMSGKMTSTAEDQQMMFQAIRARLKGDMPDDDWKCFLDLVNSRFSA